jgi:hypothetical protein
MLAKSEQAGSTAAQAAARPAADQEKRPEA